MSYQKLFAQSKEHAEQLATGYLTKGYSVANRTEQKITLQKLKQFKIAWAIVGFLMCGLPLFIYLIIYAMEPSVRVADIFIMPPETTQPT